MKTDDLGISRLRVVSLAGLMLVCGGCEKKASTGSGEVDGSGAVVVKPDAGEAVVRAAVGEVAVPGGTGVAVQAPTVRMWSAEDAGFAKHLPADTSWYVEARHLDHVWSWVEQFQDSEVAAKLKELMDAPDKLADAAEEAGVEGVDELPVEEIEKFKDNYGKPALKVMRSLFGEEVFVSVRGLDWWMQGMETYLVDSNRLVMSILAENAAKGELDLFGLTDDVEGVEEQLLETLKGMLEEVDGKPVLGMQFGGKVSEGRAEVLASLQEWMAQGAGESEYASAHTFEKGGVTWTGMKLDWSLMIDVSEEEVPELDLDHDAAAEDADEAVAEEEIDEEEPAELEALLEEEGSEQSEEWLEMRDTLMEEPLVLAWAEVGDYVVFYAGLGEHSLEVAPDVSGSLAGRADFKFLEEFPQKTVLGVSWLDGDLVGALYRQNSWESAWVGVAEGLEKVETMKSAPRMAESARKIAALTKARDAGTAHSSVGALIVDKGLRFESRGGWLGRGTDLASPLKLAGAMTGGDRAMLLRAHWKVAGEHVEQGVRSFEEFVKIVRMIGDEMKVAMEREAAEEDDEEEEDKMKRMADLYQKELVRSVEDLWEGYRDHFLKAVDGERALMIDLEGEPPPMVGLEEDTLENGKIPRFAYVRPVKDRGELKQTWELWRGSGVRLLGMLSEAIEQPIPFPDTLSADKDDLRTHFFAMPFATDDFLPSISVSDELLVVGSSKSFSEELYEAIVENPAEGEAPTGVIAEFNAEAFWDFCDAWLDVSVMKAQMKEELDAEPDEEAAEDLEPGVDVPVVPEENGIELELDQDGIDIEFDLDQVDEDDGEGPSVDTVLGALDLGDGKSWADYVSQGIDQARWFRGGSYRRWLDDGVPRSSFRINWGNPAGLERDSE